MVIHVGILSNVASWLGLSAQPASPFSSSDHLAEITMQDLYGLARDITVTRDRAMRLAPVSKGRRMIAGTIGQMELSCVKGNKPAPIQPSLFAQPERHRPLSATLTWTADALMFYPCTWWIVQERDSYGWPIWVKLLDRADAGFDSDGKLISAWGEAVTDRDIIQFDAIDAGFLHDGRETIQRAIAINRAAAHAEDNPVPSIDLHNEGADLGDEEIDKFIKLWVEARKNHGVGYSSKSVKVQTLGQHPEQLLIDGRKAINLELVRHIGIPAWAADVVLEGSSLHYENRSSRNWELIDLACSPIMTAIAGRLSMPDVTPRGWKTQLLTDSLTRPSMKERFDTYKVGIDGQFITQDQIDAWEGWQTA